MPVPPSPAPPPRLFARAVLALGLLVGFHVLAIAIVVALLLVPYVELRSTNRLHFHVAFVSLLAAGAILLAIVPRPRRFVPPGPTFERERHPRLFQLVDEVAASARQAPPRDVYLLGDANAWVAERGGILGLGGRRMMGLGLPLFSALSVRELRAVIAHEFGHYAGGDTRLGGIVHTTREAIGRTLAYLRAGDREVSLLQQPFVSYAGMFLRVTQSVSREQERAADALAARLEGGPALASGLRKLAILESVFGSFVQSELNHALRAKRFPPIVEGFELYLAARSVRESYTTALLKVPEWSRSAAGGPPRGPASYDSHPPLHERIDALVAPDAAANGEPDVPAARLVDDWPAIERRLVGQMNGQEADQPSIAWDDMAEEVYLPGHVEDLQALRQDLAGRTIEELGRDIEPLCRRALRIWLRDTPGAQVAPGDPGFQGLGLLRAAIVLTLKAQGWTASTRPGEAITMRLGERKLADELQDRFEGAMDADGWSRLCAELDIGHLRITIPEPSTEPAKPNAAVDVPT